MNLVSGYPFWLIKDGLIIDYPSLQQDIKTEVLIIGAGISGALAGYYLINAGVDCMVADARSIGLGSTCASTSLLQYEIDVPLTELAQKRGTADAVRAYKICEASIEKLRQLTQTISFTDFQLKKSLYYSAYKKDDYFLQGEFAMRKKHGFKVHYLDAVTVKKDFGFEATAILSDTAAQTNAYTLTHALHQSTIKKGLRVYDRTLITKLTHNKNKIVLQTEKGYIITAKKIVFANGYEAVKYIGKKIADLNSTYACISEPLSQYTPFWKDDALIWNTADPYLYLRNTPDKRIIVGGRDERFSNAISRDKLLPLKTKQLEHDFIKLFPKIPFKTEFSWAGTFGSTKDGLPFIGHYKKMNNCFFALGFGGNGITFSLIAAEMITALITKGRTKDNSLFSFDRL
jgi:glycine/D-amino acid oxidase-like deaminating enzyme